VSVVQVVLHQEALCRAPVHADDGGKALVTPARVLACELEESGGSVGIDVGLLCGDSVA
jgi:hypothetical protein